MISRFIAKANLKHNNKYTYNNVHYINAHTKVSITCSEHGEFLQTPDSHTRGSGCPKCADITRKQTRLEKYGSEYWFSAPMFVDIKKTGMQAKYGVDNPAHSVDIQNKKKSTMLQRYGVEHNWEQGSILFDQRNNTWVQKYGVDNPWKSPIIREKIKQTCLDRYGVDNPWKSPIIREKIKQTCLDRYGVDHHWKNDSIRSKQYNTNMQLFGTQYKQQQHLIDILPLIQDYDWLFDQYINQQKTATYIAAELGIAQTTILDYLHKHEIQIRYNIQYSYICIQWLELIMEQENIYIQHALNGGEYQILGTKFKADGYCQETNTIYEFHGDYFHGNPQLYESCFVNNITGLTAGELYLKTIEREDIILSLGYNLVVMWESDFNAILKGECDE